MKLLSRIWAAFSLKGVAAHLRKLVVAVIGGTVLLLGIALIVLPGPAFIVIPVGLAILATEFAWARHTLKRTRDFVSRRKNRKRGALAHAEK
jgi:tellurite resistance protein TerC